MSDTWRTDGRAPKATEKNPGEWTLRIKVKPRPSSKSADMKWVSTADQDYPYKKHFATPDGALQASGTFLHWINFERNQQQKEAAETGAADRAAERSAAGWPGFSFFKPKWKKGAMAHLILAVSTAADGAVNVTARTTTDTPLAKAVEAASAAGSTTYANFIDTAPDLDSSQWDAVAVARHRLDLRNAARQIGSRAEATFNKMRGRARGSLVSLTKSRTGHHKGAADTARAIARAEEKAARERAAVLKLHPGRCAAAAPRRARRHAPRTHPSRPPRAGSSASSASTRRCCPGRSTRCSTATRTASRSRSRRSRG